MSGGGAGDAGGTGDDAGGGGAAASGEVGGTLVAAGAAISKSGRGAPVTTWLSRRWKITLISPIHRSSA